MTDPRPRTPLLDRVRLPRRLGRLSDAVAADRDRMSSIHELEGEYRARGGRPAAPAVHWMLQELRVAQFAQGLGTRGPASAKQVRRALKP